MKIIFLPIFVLLMISCTNTSSPQEIAEMEIENILDEIKTEFNLGNIESFDAIMQNYHPDFLHDNGDYFTDFADVQIIWESRSLDYSIISFSDIGIELDDQRAIVTMQMHLDEDTFSEPQSFGDVSYFYYTNLGWKIGGNNFIF